MNLEFELRWRLEHAGTRFTVDPTLFRLLEGVREGGHLNYAAKAAEVSYRHAWGLVREWESQLGIALLASRRGRGAHLTPFGEALLEIAADVDSALHAPLERTALAAAASLSGAYDHRRHAITMNSGHDPVAIALREILVQSHRVTLEFSGSSQALMRYRRGETELAGFHLPLGESTRDVAAALITQLDNTRDQIWLLGGQTLGLVSRRATTLTSIADLATDRRRCINRQPGSAARLIFDALLTHHGITPDAVDGYADEEYTHNAVAAHVASGHADFGFAAATAAEVFDLAFLPITEVRFYVTARRDGDSTLRRAISDFCATHLDIRTPGMKADELNPTVAVLKRVHRAGFWKASPDGG